MITSGILTRIRIGLERRRRWYWPAMAALGLSIVWAVHTSTDALEQARRSWDDTVAVWVAVDQLAPGDPVAGNVTHVQYPAAIAPPDAWPSPTGTVRQRVDRNSALTVADVAPSEGPLALAPRGWGVVSLVEPVPSGATVSEWVAVVADGIELVADALVVGKHGDATLVAVPRRDAPAVVAANDLQRAGLVRRAATQPSRTNPPVARPPNP